MGELNIVVVVPGVQAKEVDRRQIDGFIASIAGLLPHSDERRWSFQAFAWEDELLARQNLLCSIANRYGNWLARKIANMIIRIGGDMAMILQSMRGGKLGWVAKNTLDELALTIDLAKKGYLKDGGDEVKVWLIGHSFGSYLSLLYTVEHPETDIGLITMGSPDLLFSPAFSDWGSPRNIPNLKSWTDIKESNDPISPAPMSDNPNPEWQKFVKGIVLSSPHFWPIKSHTAYWSDERVHSAIAKTLVG